MRVNNNMSTVHFPFLVLVTGDNRTRLTIYISVVLAVCLIIIVLVIVIVALSCYVLKKKKSKQIKGGQDYAPCTEPQSLHLKAGGKAKATPTTTPHYWS